MIMELEKMKNFMIGMYGKYDEVKFNRDFRENFYGIEACLLRNEEEVEHLIKSTERNGIRVGIHFPLRFGISRLRDQQFLSLDEDIRKNAYKYIEEELEYIRNKGMKPEYILFHYPKPVILKENFNMDNWRFADKSEYVYEKDYSFMEFKKHSENLFSWLSEKSFEYNFIPVLEFDALNKYVFNDDFFETLLEKYKRVKICLDTGRLHLQNKIDSNFDDKEVIKKYAKYTEVVHLWNVKVPGNLENNHFPALPNLKIEDGWAPIEEYLKIIAKENPKVKVMFEHRSDLISDEELEKCYSWISKI
jgi:sugar phosphate isomerase/epimerase